MRAEETTTQQTSAYNQLDKDRNYVHAHCMDFPEGEVDKFYVGSEDYNIYEGMLHQQEGANNILKKFKGHTAPVTRVHAHPGFS
jgi:hypothetical protein